MTSYCRHLEPEGMKLNYKFKSKDGKKTYGNFTCPFCKNKVNRTLEKNHEA